MFWRKKEPQRIVIEVDVPPPVECAGCGVMVAMWRAKPVTASYSNCTYQPVPKTRHYCTRCAPPYDEQVILSDYSLAYFRTRMRVDEKGEPIGYVRVKARRK